MRLLIDERFATAPIVEALRNATVPFETVLKPVLVAANVGADEAALISSGEYGALAETHAIESSLAIVFDRQGPVALRTPVRPDGVEQTPIRLLDVSSGGELLTRATLDPFFGITPAGFFRDDAPDAEAVVVEGVQAVTPPEVGYSEDLTKAWYVLTSESYVSHLLVLPNGAEPDLQAEVRSAANSIRDAIEEHRRDIRTRIVKATGVDRDALTALNQATRWSLEQTDRRALLMLLQLGNRRGEVGPYVSALKFVGEG